MWCASLRYIPLLMFAVCLSDAAGPPGSAATPRQHLLLALNHLSDIDIDQRPYYRFISWYSVPKDKVRMWQQVMCWWLNMMSTEQHPAIPEVVEGSDGLLWVVDIRDYNWNARGWRVVARRDPFFAEPWMDTDASLLLRNRLGEKPIEKDTGEVPVIGMIPAAWLFRETIESSRSDSYYDLLYARQRFPDGKDAVDFPENEDQWNEFWGIKAVDDFLAKVGVDTSYGAIVAGGDDDPVSGSIVSRNNRVVTIKRIPSGVSLKTFDTDRTSGDTDYIEKAPDVARGKTKFKAAELLVTLLNGGQAGLLINDKRQRIEAATGDFVHPRGPDKRVPDVRTMMSCVICHAPDGGFILPQDMYGKLKADGISIKVKDRKLYNRIQAFFEGWEEQVKGWQQPYFTLIRRTTANRLILGDKGLTPVKLMTEFMAFRDWYDKPVTPLQASIEMGISEGMLQESLQVDIEYVNKYSGQRIPVGGFARLKQLSRSRSIPRRTWDDDTYRYAQVVYRSYIKSRSGK